MESEAEGRKALAHAAATRDAGYPHLKQAQREWLDRYLLGFIVWSEVVARFGLPQSVLKETYDPQP